MKIRAITIIATIASYTIIATNVFAITLLDVYNQAIKSDPTFKAAQATWLAEQKNLPIKKAALFPQLSATAGVSSDNSYDTTSRTANYQLTLSQSIFDFGKWATVWYAQAIVKKAQATYMSAIEDLLLRTAKAYFDVLKAKDFLHYAKANKGAFNRLLVQNKHKFDVGLIPLPDLENTRAEYDKATAEEIAAQTDFEDKFEKLAEITGTRYLFLHPVKQSFPLLSPQPTDIEKWVAVAQNQNFELASARYTTITAKEKIKISNAGHLPSLNATGNYNHSHTNNYSGTDTSRHTAGTSVGATLNVPLFQGGQVTATAKQASYEYQKALEDQETTRRAVVSKTRQAYLGVLSNISQINANRQAIKSALSSLRATKAGYDAGIRTMVDVLNAQTKLYENQKNYTTSEYNYIIQLLSLKQLTGILDINDINQINSWLESYDPKSTTPAPKKGKAEKKQ